MAYISNNGYTQMYPNNNFYQPFQNPYIPQPIQQPVQQMQQSAQMSPPTIHAEIVQVESEVTAENYPVNAGSSQMMIAKDESFIAVKSTLANGQYTLDFYDKRPPAPKEPPFDPSKYIRKDEIGGIIEAALASLSLQNQPKKMMAKKEAKNESEE